MRRSISDRTSWDWTAAITLASALTFALAIFTTATQSAQAQTYQSIHNFTGATGDRSLAGLAIDSEGNLYGTTAWGGASGIGSVFELKKTASGYVYSLLHSFAGGNDGQFPASAVVIGTNGVLYGAAVGGGDGRSDGVVFSLKPPAKGCGTSCSWTESVLYRFTGGDDGRNPWGGVILDAKGNLYGTTANGATAGGVVYELIPSDGVWTIKILYTFTGGADGDSPLSGVTFDHAGNLYGTTSSGGDGGGFGNGAVYELTPSGSGWTEHTLYDFQNGSDGATPQAGVMIDSSGNVYGDTPCCGSGNGGTVFELTSSNGEWAFHLLYSLSGDFGPGPEGNLIMDSAGNLYGTTLDDGVHDKGSVFKLSPGESGWSYTSLEDFTGGFEALGATGGVVFDKEGNLYGATYSDGGSINGVVFEITP
jgi:uncharacterized repeat protein (TIGR03803 family)